VVRRRLAHGIAIASALVAGAIFFPGARAADAEHPSELVGTWQTKERHGDDVFWLEFTLFADGTYCEMSFDSGREQPFSLESGRWKVSKDYLGRQDYLDQQADRSTNPNSIQDIGSADRAWGGMAIQSISNKRLELELMMMDAKGTIELDRRKDMRSPGYCRFPEPLPRDSE
jgi:hypothetical protein